MSTQKRYTGGLEKDQKRDQQRQPLDKNQKGQTTGGGGMGKTGQTDTFRKEKNPDKGSQY